MQTLPEPVTKGQGLQTAGRHDTLQAKEETVAREKPQTSRQHDYVQALVAPVATGPCLQACGQVLVDPVATSQ